MIVFSILGTVALFVVVCAPFISGVTGATRKDRFTRDVQGRPTDAEMGGGE